MNWQHSYQKGRSLAPCGQILRTLSLSTAPVKIAVYPSHDVGWADRKWCSLKLYDIANSELVGILTYANGCSCRAKGRVEQMLKTNTYNDVFTMTRIYWVPIVSGSILNTLHALSCLIHIHKIVTITPTLQKWELRLWDTKWLTQVQKVSKS